jgi:hypothetical protein
MVRFVPTDAADWRVMGVEWIGEPAPELAYVWRAQGSSHDLPGYQHVRDAFFAHQSTADVTLTVTVDGTTYTYTIPHGAGAYVKSYVVFGPMKGRLWEWAARSGAPFRLFKKDTEVRVKAWGEAGGYSVVRPFGDEHRADGAKI